eukprot:1915197-Amphidinium_carterae.1
MGSRSEVCKFLKRWLRKWLRTLAKPIFQKACSKYHTIDQDIPNRGSTPTLVFQYLWHHFWDWGGVG